MRPLDPIERTLLARIGAEGSDEQARRVLADHWQEGADEPRGQLVLQQCEGLDARALIAEHGDDWLQTSAAAGFSGIEFERGFAATALVLERGHPLLGCPDAMRLSPRKYLAERRLETSRPRLLFEVVAHTLAGEHGRYVLETAPMFGAANIERDATVLGKLHHPNLSELFDLALRPYAGLGVVLPWAGEALEHRLRDGRGDERLAIAIGLPLCDALGALGAAGIVHTQVCPATVMLREDGHVTLAGFEYARVPGVPYRLELDDDDDEQTPPFPRFRHLAPEQARGQLLTPAIDLFALAVLLATIARGRHPLDGIRGAAEMLRAIIACAHDLGDPTPLTVLLREVLVPAPEKRPSLASFAARLAALGPRDPRLVASV